MLPAQSVATFKWDGKGSGAVDVWITTGDKGKLLKRQPSMSFN